MRLIFPVAAVFLSSLAAQIVRPLEVITSSRVDFAPGGTIRITGSNGELNIDAWDRPEVQITVSRYTEAKPSAETGLHKKLEGIQVSAKKNSPTELTIATEIAAHNWVTRALHGLTGVDLDYRIEIPRDSNLFIRHDSGGVFITGVAGSIDAAAHSSDIFVLLPDSAQYAIDAKAAIGSVYSDFDGDRRRLYLLGASFLDPGKPPAHKVRLRVGNGSITIQSANP